MPVGFDPNTLGSGKHLLTAICGNDTIKCHFVMFSLDDKTPCEETDDWFYVSDSHFSADGKPVYVQVGSSNSDTHVLYTVVSGETVLEEGSFDLNNSFKFAYLSSALYLNGAISRNKRLFWCTNTWWVVNRDKPFTLSNYEYLAYTIPLKKQQSLTPMVGTIHSWLFDQDLDLAAGCYYSIKNWNIYVWGNDYLKSHPRFIVGVDYTF